MADLATLKDLYIAELQETRSVEEQLAQALTEMADMATDGALKDALKEHLGKTRIQLDRVTAFLERHGAEPREHRDQSMQTLIAEAHKWLAMLDDPTARDAGLIASAQRIEHCEIAIYGTLACWAKQLEFDEDLETLVSILEEERDADTRLSEVAKSQINAAAA